MKATRPGALAHFLSAGARGFVHAPRTVLCIFAALSALLCSAAPGWAKPPRAYVTTLSVTSNGSAATTVATGTAITLTATTYVMYSGGPFAPSGTVRFCETSLHYSCQHLIGTAQQTPAGAATLTYVPAIGPHTYTAFYVRGALIESTPVNTVQLTVTGIPPSVTQLSAVRDIPGNGYDYALTGYVYGFGGSTPTGTVSFQDTANANYVLGSAPLGTAAFALFYAGNLGPLYQTGYGYTVAVADLNGDGIPDLLVPGGTAKQPSLQTYFGKGDGSSAAGPNTILGVIPGNLVTGDFNNDGVVDIAFTIQNGTSVTVLLGNGDGSFRSGSTLNGLGGQVQKIAVGDFNGDGNQDLAVSSFGSGGTGTGVVYVALGKGDGTFQSPQGTTLNGLNTNSDGIVAADFDGDGVLDLAVSDGNSSLSILLGNGDGTFRLQPGTAATAIASDDLRVADVNGDGVPDLLLVEHAGSSVPAANAGHVMVLLGNGDGTFRTGQLLLTGTVSANYGQYPAIAVGDFNGDGITDFAVTTPSDDYGDHSVGLYLGNGDGTFTASLSSDTFEYPYAIVTADLNGDGETDLVTIGIDGGIGSVASTNVFLSAMEASATASGITVVGRRTHGVDAVYGGSSSVLPSSYGPVQLSAQPVPTTLTLTGAPATLTQGQPVSLTAVLTPNTAQDHNASGSVTFTYGTVSVSATMSGGSAAVTTTALPAGTDCITATYAGDTNFFGSTSSQFCITVNAAPLPQTITFPQPPAPAYASTSVYLNATASSDLPVTYTIVSGPATVSGKVLTYLQPGTVVVEANQAGDGSHQAAPPVQDTVAVTVLTEPVGTTSSTLSTVVTFLAPGTFSNVAVSTHGALNADFLSASGGTCAMGHTYAAGDTCMATFSFRPQHPGTRLGGIILSDAGGNLLANSYLLGLGTGPTILYAPATQTTIANGLVGSGGVALDGVGNIYIADYFGAGVYQLSASTGQLRLIAPATLAIDVDVDGSGNVFFATRSQVGEVPAVNGLIPASPTVRLFAGSGYNAALDGVKVDGSGNLFLAQGYYNLAGGSVYELLAVNGQIPDTPIVRTLTTTGSPTGVAPDVYGNVFFSSQYDGSVYELAAVNGVVPANAPVQTITSSLDQPTNVAFDITGNLYVPDEGTHDVKKLLAVNGVVPVNPVIESLVTGLSTPDGAVVDAGGNLYVADQDLHDIVELAYSAPPTLQFADTVVGQTSSDSPQSVTLLNGGNAPLTFYSANGQTNPYINSPDFVVANSTTCPRVQAGGTAGLAPGATCAMAANFNPVTVGPQTAELVFQNTNLNAANAAQIHLEGVGLGVPPTVVFTVSNHSFGDPPFAVAATSNSPGAFTYSVVSGPATIAGSTVTLTAAGTVTLLASQAASGNYAAGSAIATFTVAKAPQTITFAPIASPVAFGTQIKLVGTASSGLPVVFSVISGAGQISGNLLTFSAADTVVVAADQPGNINYLAAPQVRQTVKVSFGPASIALTGTPNPVFFTNPITLTAALTGAGGAPTGSVQFLEGSSVLGSEPISGSLASISIATLSVGQHTVIAVYSGNGNFNSVNSAPLLVIVQDFRLTITNPNVVIDHGGAAVFDLTVSSIGGVGLASSIHLSVAGGPDRAVNTFSATDIATGSGTTPVTLTVQTPNYPTGPFGSLARTSLGIHLAFLSLGALTLALWHKRKLLNRGTRTLLAVVLIGMSFAGSTLLTGCGSGWRTQGWSLTITATSGNLSRAATATITSQCRSGQPACPIE